MYQVREIHVTTLTIPIWTKFNMRSDSVKDWQGKAIIRLGSDRNVIKRGLGSDFERQDLNEASWQRWNHNLVRILCAVRRPAAFDQGAD